MADLGRYCAECGVRVAGKGPTRRRDECASCSAELHSCVNCQHHDPDRQRGCREPNAVADEMIRDIRRANLCDWFDHRQGKGPNTALPSSDQARAAFDALFGGQRPQDDERAKAEDAFARLFKK